MSSVAKLMTVEELCEHLGVSRYFVYDQVRLGRLPCARIARQLRFRPTDVERFVDEHLMPAGVQAMRVVGRADSRPLQQRGA